MGGASLHDREIEVEQSRAKLTKDLATLCSAKTLSAFTDDLKKEAFDTRDALWEKIKARAASNPAAVIAIGTGLTSHFKRFNWGWTFQLVEDHAKDGLRRNGQTAGLRRAQQGESEGTSRASLRGSRERR